MTKTNTTSNTSKIKCAICNKWEGHVIVQHLKDAHPKVNVFDYITENDAPIASQHGYALLKDKELVSDRPRSPVNIGALFGLAVEKDEKSNPERKFVNRDVQAFNTPSVFTPPIDDDYIFPEQALRKVLVGLMLPSRNNTWIHGYAGTGKTQLVTQICARLGYGMMRVNGDSAITRRHLIGDWIVRNGETVFQYGVIPTAMRNGDVLLIDEIDHLNPPTLAMLRGVLEHPSQLMILENGNEIVKAHPNFRVVATANTAGAGDESGLFVTSRALSLADRQRFSLWVRVDYLPPVVETRMLKKRFPKLQDNELRRFYQVVKAVRNRHKTGELEESFSPREFINWVEKYFLIGDAMGAAEMCFLDRYQSPSVQVAVSEIVKAAFDMNRIPEELPSEAL